MSSGLEWNVKLTTKDMLPTIQKMEATFDSYWNTASFEVYEDGCRERLERALSTNGKANPTSEMQFVFDIQPTPTSRRFWIACRQSARCVAITAILSLRNRHRQNLNLRL